MYIWYSPHDYLVSDVDMQDYIIPTLDTDYLKVRTTFEQNFLSNYLIELSIEVFFALKYRKQSLVYNLYELDNAFADALIFDRHESGSSHD